MALPSQLPGAKFHTISSSSFSHSAVPLKNIRICSLVPRTAAGNRSLQYSQPFSSLAIASHSPNISSSFSAADAPGLISTVGSPPAGQPTQWNLGNRHILLLNVTACMVGISASWLFLSAIPTLLAFGKAVDSIAKLLEVTADELPDTMASVRLSGMEITDLTKELNDLGEEITGRVRSSTRSLRVTEERLRQLTTMNPKVLVQGQNGPMESTKRPTPPVAKKARELREGISRGRETFAIIGTVAAFSGWALGSRKKKQNK